MKISKHSIVNEVADSNKIQFVGFEIWKLNLYMLKKAFTSLEKWKEKNSKYKSSKYEDKVCY